MMKLNLLEKLVQYRRLGNSGLKVSELSLGSWITFGPNLSLNNVKECMRYAYDQGINFFDNAEAYGNGLAELMMGEALRDFRREELVISTKIFWGGDNPNATGLSWKHMVEGVKNSLRRLQLDYVDLLFCHRPDPDTPIEETVRAMDTLIKQGLIFYWGTSEWSAKDIEAAFKIAKETHTTPPVMEQPEYNMFNRTRIEKEYTSLFKRHQLGTTIWSPLNSGILSGKYNKGIPKNSRLDRQKWLSHLLTEEKIQKVKKLSSIAKELNCSMSQLAIAWCLKNPNVSTVILGTSSMEQLSENIQASTVVPYLDQTIMKKINTCLKG